MSYLFVYMYFRINGHLKSAEIKTTEIFHIFFEVTTAKKNYNCRNNLLYGFSCTAGQADIAILYDPHHSRPCTL